MNQSTLTELICLFFNVDRPVPSKVVYVLISQIFELRKQTHGVLSRIKFVEAQQKFWRLW